MQAVFHRRFSTELGELELSATANALVGLEFVDDPAEQASALHAKGDLHQCVGRGDPARRLPGVSAPRDQHADPAPSTLLDRAERQIREYLEGTRREFDLPLDLDTGTEFQREVWRGLQEIPYGETLSYRELACCVGRPRAARAVGNANHHNPISIIVPCHRVIAADGSLGGYGGSVWRKEFLLDLESRNSTTLPD